MADYSTYLQIDGTDMPGNDRSHQGGFAQNQHSAIYQNYTAYNNEAPPKSTPARIRESLQGRAAIQESKPLLSGGFEKSYKPSADFASSTDSVYEPKKRTGVWLALFVIFYVFYLVLGSVAFEGMEVNSEIAEREDFREVRHRFLQKYSDVLDADIEEFIEQVTKLQGHGVSPLHNATSELNWSFGQALFFSSTVITTIGYGHVTPLTQAGKLFCILYATIGIPLTLVLLSAIVERLLVPAAWLLGKLNSRMGHIYQPFSIRLIHLAIIVAIFAIIFLALPTLVFARLEPDWTTLDAFYYCFISLTTIGLGDFIPGDDPVQANRSLYKVFTTVYLIVGLVAVMLCLTVFYDIPQLNLGQLFSDGGGGVGGGGGGRGAASESEPMRLSLNGAQCYSSGGPSGLYIPQRDDEARRSVVRIRPRGDESPSPDEERAPTEIRVP